MFNLTMNRFTTYTEKLFNLSHNVIQRIINIAINNHKYYIDLFVLINTVNRAIFKI